jgi:hypothetical protein
MKDDEILPLEQHPAVREMAAHLPRKAHREKPIKKDNNILVPLHSYSYRTVSSD